MDIATYVVFLALGASIVVCIHEAGHFLAAKFVRVRVQKFSVGIGPTLLKRFDSTGTEYSFNLLPLGALVVIPNEAADDNGTRTQDSFRSTTPIRRLFITVAGSGANFLLAFLLLLAFAAFTDSANQPVVEVSDTASPAFLAGIRSGDVVVKVDGKDTPSWGQIGRQLLSHVGTDNPITFEVDRSGQSFVTTMNIVDWQSDSRQMDILRSLGLEHSDHSSTTVTSLGSFLVYPVVETFEVSIAVIAAGFKMIWGDISILNFMGALQLSVLGLDNTDLFTTEARSGLEILEYLTILAVISIINGVINLLPGPLVDGAGVLCATTEVITRKNLNFKVETAIIYVGSVFAFGPLVICIVHETLRFLN